MLYTLYTVVDFTRFLQN